MDFHEYAQVFPMMNDDEYGVLLADMQEYGYDGSCPIALCDGKILDGRNRYKAAQEAGVEPTYTDFEGDNALAFVIRRNLKRRHLNESQRAVIAGRLATMRQGERTDLEPSANLPKVISQSEAAEMLGVSERSVRTVKAVERQAPDLIPAIERGEITAHRATKLVRQREIQSQRQELVKTADSVPKSDRWNVWCADIETWQAPRQYDFIITDPPYPKEYLHLYETVARQAKQWLKPGGLLVVMCGQSYINQIYQLMDKHLAYYWTACYLTPGQPTPLRQVNVNTTWKPLLIYSLGKYQGKIFGDVFKSDANDKDFHKWGQSVSGMTSIISMMCLPGQYILDPFCGAGTTGVAAVAHGCFFDGIDNQEENVKIAMGRLNDQAKT